MITHLCTGINYVGLPYSNAGGLQTRFLLSCDNYVIKKQKRLREALMRFRRCPVSMRPYRYDTSSIAL